MITMTIAMMMGLLSCMSCYKARKAKKASIKEGLLPIAWHPSRHWNWCVPEDERKEKEKMWA